MNAILFGLKRAFQASIRSTRAAVASFGLTAARFDMLHAIQESYRRQITQSDLRRTLGVTAPTVSRMLRSLEKLGLVTRARPPYGDTRQRIVSLTKDGLLAIRRAFKYIVAGGAAQLAFDSVLTAGRHYSPAACLLETDIAESVCRRIRHGFSDSANLRYPWHPDD